ncbi:hypothetical protein Tco_1143893 [Tanacetum coccineum]
MRNQWILDLVLGGKRRVNISSQLVLGGVQLEDYSLPAQPRLKVNPLWFQMTIFRTSRNANSKLLDVSAELGIHDHNNELSSSKLVPKVVPPADKTDTSRQELELLFHHHLTMLRIHKDGDGDASFQLESNSLPHAHAQTTKTYYKHQDSRIMKA